MAGGIALPLPSSSLPLEEQLAVYTSNVNNLKKQIEALNAQLKALKPPKPGTTGKSASDYAAAKNRLEIQLAQMTSTLTSQTKKQSELQNKVWTEKGEFDKLLTGTDRDAYLAVQALFKSFGLDSLSAKIFDYVKNGYSPDTISLLLQDTPEYKKRFAANEARLKAGLPVLSPAEYISVENSYRQIMRQSGLPTGFYDSVDDFTQFLTNDMAPTELQKRVDLATEATVLANPAFKQALNQLGIGDGEMAAYFIDPNRALPYIQKSAATAAIGAEALKRGLAFNPTDAENLVTGGVSRDQAAQGYQQIGTEIGGLTDLASIYGGAWNQQMAEQDVFVGGNAASEQRNRLIGREKGTFSGTAGGSRGGLAQRGGAR